jgi:hypothetical protein
MTTNTTAQEAVDRLARAMLSRYADAYEKERGALIEEFGYETFRELQKLAFRRMLYGSDK